MKLSKMVAIPVLVIILLLSLLMCANAATDTVSCGEVTYATLADAVNASESGSVLQLNQEIKETLVVQNDVILDLNGYSIDGTITVAEGYTLLVKDSTTDDFTAESYGKITASGNVQAANGYLAITEENGTSFHRLDLRITTVNLRPTTVGIYYGGSFGGDEAVKALVEYYGTALSLTGTPTIQEIKADKHYSKHTAFSGDSWVCGETGKAYGTLLKGIWKDRNYQQKNADNAKIKIYSASYVQLKDGTIILGTPVSMSLRELIEKIDTRWSTLDSQQIKAVYAMYEEHKAIMDAWSIPNLKWSEGHYLDEGVIGPEATVYDEGVKLYTCLDCGYEKERILPQTPSFTVEFYNKDNRMISRAKYALKTTDDQIAIPNVRADDGYKFNAWVDETTGKTFDQIDYVSTLKDTIYQFSPTFTKTYEVSFVYYESNGLLTEDILIMEENQEIQREDLPEIPFREGYTSKWDAKITGTKVSGDLSFSPIYEIKTFTVTFLDAKGGKELAEPETVEYGGTVVAPEHVPYRYTSSKLYGFTGWKSSATDKLISNLYGNRVVKITENLTLYPAYESSITAPVVAAHIDGETVTMSLCMPDNTTLYSINLSIGWITEGVCEINSASIIETTSLNANQCDSSNAKVHIDRSEWVKYNNKTKTFDFVWGCGAGHSFKIDHNLISLRFGTNNGAEVSEEIFHVLKGSNIVYGEKGGNISKAEKTDIILWFY